MIAADTPQCVLVGDSTAGTSDSSFLLKRQMDEIYKNLRDAPCLSDGRDNVLEDVMILAKSCAEAGWDGYEAEAVNRRTLRNAQAFIEALPQGIAMPTVGAEPDGHLTLEWYRDPNWVLSVSISPDKNLYYAAMLGPANTHGAEPFLDQVPRSLLLLIDRLHLK
jgi:hypothetical protein